MEEEDCKSLSKYKTLNVPFKVAREIKISKYFYNHEQVAVSVPCRKEGSKILKPCGIISRQLFLSGNLIRKGSEILNTFKNFEQIAVFVPCRDGGSEILNPCGIVNRLSFCSVKLWAGGSEILNLSN